MKKLFVFSVLALGFSSQAFATFKGFYGCYDTVSIDGTPIETPVGMNGKSSIKVNPYGSFIDENWQDLKSVAVEAFFMETWTDEDGNTSTYESFAQVQEILPGGAFNTQDGSQCHNFNGDVFEYVHDEESGDETLIPVNVNSQMCIKSLGDSKVQIDAFTKAFYSESSDQNYDVSSEIVLKKADCYQYPEDFQKSYIRFPRR